MCCRELLVPLPAKEVMEQYSWLCTAASALALLQQVPNLITGVEWVRNTIKSRNYRLRDLATCANCTRRKCCYTYLTVQCDVSTTPAQELEVRSVFIYTTRNSFSTSTSELFTRLFICTYRIEWIHNGKVFSVQPHVSLQALLNIYYIGCRLNSIWTSVTTTFK